MVHRTRALKPAFSSLVLLACITASCPSVVAPIVSSAAYPPKSWTSSSAARKAARLAELAGVHPSSLSIPSIKLTAPVIDIGLLPGGKLDVPADRGILGWYNLGPRPGEQGNSVIDGHLNTKEGDGAFWNLKHVKVGDLVHVSDKNGITKTFRVREMHVYPVADAPMKKIFGYDKNKHLNLITCAGVWRKEFDHYDKRLVVFTDLVEDANVASLR
jgi:LPXTG-site transpeptidase (sortase) family protein